MRLGKLLFTIVFVLVVIDQISKWLVETNLPFQQPVDVITFFSLFRTYNLGVAFSMLSWVGNGGLIALTLLIIGFMGYLWSKVESHQQLAHLGFALVVAGALGNLIDRVTQGHVIDFLLVHTETWAFAVFNIADSYITVGAIAIVIEELFSIGQKKSQNIPDDPS